MNQKLLNKVFVWGFLFLYLLVACISFCHAVEFFNIGNANWMSITLAFAFELGLALSLAAILLSDSNSKNVLPWILMIILCAVQVIGNVFSTYKHIALSETEYYQYLAQPLLFWIEEISEESVRIIISWIIGAILPIIALFMTDMVASNLKTMNGENPQDNKTNESHADEVDKREEILAEEEELIAAAPAPIVKDEPIQEEKPKEKSFEIEEGEEEDIDVPTLEPKKETSILKSVKSLFTKPRAVEQPVEVTPKEDEVINNPTNLTNRTGYTARPSYYKSPENITQ